MKRLVMLSALLLLFVIKVTAAQQQTVITGTLLGSDNKPLVRSDLHLILPSDLHLISTPGNFSLDSEIGADGRFKITTDQTGLLFINFTGINHYSKYIALIVEKPTTIELNVKLAAYQYPDQLKNVSVLGNFNDLSPASALPMTKQADGTYLIEFDTKLDKIEYGLVNVENSTGPINGTQAEGYHYNNYSDSYLSIITPRNGKARIVFDPQRLVRSSEAAQIKFDDQHASIAKFVAIYEEMRAYYATFSNAFNENRFGGKTENEFLKSFGKAMEQEQAIRVKQLSTEKDPLIRQLLYIAYLTAYPGVQKKDKEMARKALLEMPATSPVWGIAPYTIFDIADVVDEGDKYDNYIEQNINSQKSKDEKGGLLLWVWSSAQYKHQQEQADKYFKILTSDEFRDTKYGKEAISYTSKRNIKVGNYVPNFSFVALDKADKSYTKDSMKGKVYLIDFWATWCGPCVGEMETLHKAYEKFKDKNFEILSLSFDASPDDVRKFRNGKWKMPWLHSFIENGANAESAKEFETTGIPKPILVDANGKIIAMEADLRGENLEKTLARVLGETK